jgi:hypothetical protein
MVGHSSASTATICAPSFSFSQSPAPSVPAEPLAETKAASFRPGWCACTALNTCSKARPVTL